MTDEELVRVAVVDPSSQSSRDAAAELLGRYQEAVYVRALRYVRDPDRAMDMAQDVLLAAYQKMGTFQGRSRFSAWLFTITRNRCLNEVKRDGFFDKGEFDPEWVASRDGGPDAQFEEREDEERLLELIQATLDPIEQKTVWLRCEEGMSVDEITRLLEIDTRSGARGVLQTARRKLKKAMS